MALEIRAALRHRRAAIYTIPPAARTAIGVVDLIALAATGVVLGRESISSADLVRFCSLLAVAVLYGQFCGRVEPLRRLLGDDTVRTNHLSAWTLAGLMLLPTGLAALLMLAIYAYVAAEGHRVRAIKPYRLIFTASAAVVSTLVAGGAASRAAALFSADQHGLVRAAVACAVFLSLDLAIVTAVVRLASGSTPKPVIGRDDLVFELATMAIGVVAAQLVISAAWLAPLMIGALIGLHRVSLVKQLQEAASCDPKTGLLNAAAWRERSAAATASAVRVRRRVAVMVIDLDHFKRINDRYGHLAGDEVLLEVAQVLRRETRVHDLVGRFGGEEFVILVDSNAAAAHAVDMATRIRERIARLEVLRGVRVTASIGVAHGVPRSVGCLDDLLGLADRALYIAKNSGRDRVHALIGNEVRRLGPAIERRVEQFGPPRRDARPARSVVGQ